MDPYIRRLWEQARIARQGRLRRALSSGSRYTRRSATEEDSSTVLTVFIAQSSDDAREAIATTVNTLTDTGPTWNQAGIVALRFVFSPAIPQGTPIQSAILSVAGTGADVTAFVGLIEGEAALNGATFQAVNEHISGRRTAGVTTATVTVTNPVWTGTNEYVALPDIKEILQELVDQDDISALVLFLTEVSGSARVFRAIDFNSGTHPPKLVVNW